MKYSREDVKSMYPITYRELICEELNNAGFQHEFQGEWMGYTPDYSTFGGVIVKDGQAVRYLKMIGLKRANKITNCLGISLTELHVKNELPGNEKVEEGDELVCYGRYRDFQALWKAI